MKFQNLIHLLFEDDNSLNTPRKSMLKIYQMTPKKFVQFLKDISKYISDGKIDGTKIKITEKIDGTSFKLAWFNNKLLGESSYSGLKDVNGFGGPFGEPFRETLKYLQNKLTPKFEKLFKDQNFKLVGELLYTKNAQLDQDNTVTIIATKYDPKKLGKIATFVIFDVLKYNKDDNSFVKMDSREKFRILGALSRWSDGNIKFLMPNEIRYSGHIYLVHYINPKQLQDILKNPEILLADKELFNKVKDGFIKAFEMALKSAGSKLGNDASKIEGFVIDLGDYTVGFQNPEWKEEKEKLWSSVHELDEIFKNYLYNIFGFKIKRKILSLIDNVEYQSKYKQETIKLKQILRNFKAKFDSIKQNLPKNLTKNFEKTINFQLNNLFKLDENDIFTLKKLLNKEPL